MPKSSYSVIPLLLVLASLFLTNCFFEQNNNNHGGVALSFDDRFVSNWVWADSVLADYNWKATFFIHGPQYLTHEQLNSLREFKAYGHELAGHGMSHLNALDYIAENSIPTYLNNEILPMINLMKNEGLEPQTFAYPYGTHNEEIDDTLLTYFKVLRSTTYTWLAPEKQVCYYKNSPIVNGLGIDGVASQERLDYLLSLVEYAHNNNKVVIFYSHRPVAEVTGSHQTDIITLQAICEYMQENKMRFYTFSELNEE